jgi:hypothetical protein
MSKGRRSEEAGRGEILDWLHEQGQRREATVPEFDVEKTLRLVRAARGSEARDFWADLTPAEREAFKSAAREQTFPDGTVLMRQDEPADSIMVIPGDMIGESGRVAGNVRWS